MPGRRDIILSLAALPLASTACATMETPPMADNAALIRDFIAAWSRLDPSELAAFFAEDGIYHNIPAAPVRGRQNIEKFIAGFIKPWSSTHWDLLNLVVSGEIVVAERLDRSRVGEREINLPCCGVFEMSAGKIKVWRDYFDMQTYVKALSGA